MRPAREFLWLPLLVAVAALLVFAWHMRAEGEAAGRRAAQEVDALALLRQVAAAQASYHERHGRYGWLEDLRAERLLPDVGWQTLEEELAVASPGYRIDVVLPATAGTPDAVALAPRREARLNARLARKHFAVVARPWGDGAQGWRTFYLDDAQRVYVNEGVSDPSTRRNPPLPVARVPEGGGTGASGLRWWKLDDLPPR